VTWRILYRADRDAIVIAEELAKKTMQIQAPSWLRRRPPKPRARARPGDFAPAG